MRSALPLPCELLDEVAHFVDLACVGRRDHTVLFVEVEGADLAPDEVRLGLRTFAGHPTEVLEGLVAPPRWWALVLCTAGKSHFLDQPDRPPEHIVSTYARSRDGDEVSLLRRGRRVTRLVGPAEGRIPDLVRTILATPPGARPPDPTRPSP